MMIDAAIHIRNSSQSASNYALGPQAATAATLSHPPLTLPQRVHGSQPKAINAVSMS